MAIQSSYFPQTLLGQSPKTSCPFVLRSLKTLCVYAPTNTWTQAIARTKAANLFQLFDSFNKFGCIYLLIQDKTFGLKNKKGAKQQKFIKAVTHQVKFGQQNPRQVSI